MSTSNNDSTTSSEPLQSNRILSEEDLSNWFGVRLGHEGMMLDKIQRQNQLVHDQVASQLRSAGYDIPEHDEGEEGEGEMGVSIGNKQYYYPPQPKQSGISLGSAMIPTSLLAAGAMTAGAIYTGLQGQPVIQTPPPIVDTDTTTDVNTGFGEPVYKSEKLEK